MTSTILIQDLKIQVQNLIEEAEKLHVLDLPTLTWRPAPDVWSILECFEHLNRYGDFYLPQLKAKIENSDTQPETDFQNGWLGGYFAKSMLPKEKLNKMKTFRDKNPLHAQLDKKVIDRFVQQQVDLLDLLEESKGVSWNKIRIETSISSLIRLRLGDTFQFLVNHMIRHFAQIERVQKSYIGH